MCDHLFILKGETANPSSEFEKQNLTVAMEEEDDTVTEEFSGMETDVEIDGVKFFSSKGILNQPVPWKLTNWSLVEVNILTNWSFVEVNIGQIGRLKIFKTRARFDKLNFCQGPYLTNWSFVEVNLSSGYTKQYKSD